MYENKKIFVLGMARSGYNIAKLLADKNEILITDMSDQDSYKVKELESLGVKFVKTDKPLELFDKTYDVLIKNPGIMPFHEVVLKAKELNIPVVNEMEVTYHYLPKDITIIGVTGSNGKTTTTTMIYELLKKLNLPVVLGGNIGYPLSEVVSIIKPKDILLLEISDHQLINFKDFKTNISVLTNICPTHLDYHGNYENYKNTKKNIFLNHSENDIAILNKANADGMSVSSDIPSHKEYIMDENNYYNNEGIFINNEKILDLKDIKVKGSHNYENILDALMVVKNFGLDKEIIKSFFIQFGGVEHRIEFVREFDGVKYYNDSKATNPTSTVIAISAFSEPIHLILGGMQRSQNFHELDSVINKVKKIYAIGEVTDAVYDYAKELNIPCEKCYTLSNAMQMITPLNGEVVLLSPASASWDQYKKFEDRGDEFKDLVNKL